MSMMDRAAQLSPFAALRATMRLECPFGLQQCEQRQKNSNKVQAEYLVMLARSLCCDTEDILEKAV